MEAVTYESELGNLVTIRDVAKEAGVSVATVSRVINGSGYAHIDTKKAVEIVAGRCETESSGGITYETMLPYAQAGVDFISFGALTHSVKGMDMSFKAC